MVEMSIWFNKILTNIFKKFYPLKSNFLKSHGRIYNLAKKKKKKTLTQSWELPTSSSLVFFASIRTSGAPFIRSYRIFFFSVLQSRLQSRRSPLLGFCSFSSSFLGTLFFIFLIVLLSILYAYICRFPPLESQFCSPIYWIECWIMDVFVWFPNRQTHHSISSPPIGSGVAFGTV